jgi:NADPH2:quinone reductase
MSLHRIAVHETGGPEVLRLEEVALPDPGPGQVRVRVSACGVNFIDVYHRTGLYPRPLPFGAGIEGAGTVEAVGPEVTTLAEGDRVAWASAPDSYADAILAPAALLVRIPDGVEDRVAAAAILQGMTAHYLAHGTRETLPGDTALVHAAAGGTGRLLVQMLVRAGARVIGTCSTAEKERLVRAAGAEHVVRYTETDFAEEARRITDGRGVDVVYDSVGRSNFDGSLASLKTRGILVLFGQSSGPVPPFDPARLTPGSLFVTRPSLAHYSADPEEREMRASAVYDAIRAGELEVRIGGEFPLADAAEAHRALESRKTTGKLLLIP